MKSLIITVLSILALGAAAEWPNYRGPDHQGTTKDKFPEGQPKLVWEQPIGSAFSQAACVDGRVYTCGTKDKQQTVVCMDAKTGKIAWERPFEAELKDKQGGDGTRGTPTVHDGRVYIVGGSGTFACLDAKSGEPLWTHTFKNKPHWAYSCSVLIEGDLALATPGGDDGGIAAYDRKTGKPVWKCATDKPAYSTPYPFDFKGKRYVFCYVAKHGLIADPKTGREVGRIPWETDYEVNASAPQYADGHILLSTGYKTGSALYKLDSDGDKIKATEVWRQKDLLLTKFTSVVLKGKTLYGGDQKGLWAVDLMSGNKLWGDEGLDNAGVLLADDQLVILSEKGELIIAPAVPEGFKPATRAPVLDGRCWTVPTLYDGKLYVRNLKKIACYEMK